METEMKLHSKKFLWFLGLAAISACSIGLYSKTTVLDKDISQIFLQSCSTTGCHSGAFPAMNLNLEAGNFRNSLENVPSQQLKHLMRVDTEHPEKSYLLMKIKGDEAIEGKQMPLNAALLPEEEIKVVENWIYSLKESKEMDVRLVDQKKIPDRPTNSREKDFIKPSFWGTRLINLPTDQSIGKNQVLFRISHRYFPSVTDGYDDFYGLDGPAAILLSLGYGISDKLGLTLARSNLFKEVELSLKWLILEQLKKTGSPISAALYIGGALVTQKEEGKKTFRADNMRFNSQLILSHQFSNSLSLLLVPSYSSNTNHWEEESEGTFSLGIGARYMFLDDLSFIVEWIPVMAGYKANASSWGFGVEKKIGGHVFQIFMTNTVGLTSAQFIPGGELKIQDGDFRFGFNIFRLF